MHNAQYAYSHTLPYHIISMLSSKSKLPGNQNTEYPGIKGILETGLSEGGLTVCPPVCYFAQILDLSSSDIIAILIATIS